MKLIIDIPEEYYNNLLKNCRFSSEEIPIVSLAMAVGIPLEKHDEEVIKAVKGMPSVQPKSKTGHWILDETDNSITCNKCGCLIWASDLCHEDAQLLP